MKGGGTIMHSFGGFTRFVTRPCRDAGLSWHCEDFVLLYRVMQGLVPVGTNRHFLNMWSCTPYFHVKSGVVLRKFTMQKCEINCK